ncbi:MAG: IS481 family transposase, partial [Candidatus Lumbricidophila eiseniae]
MRASHRTQLHYERQQPGALVHIDVKKLGRIPDNGRWRPDGPDTIDHNRSQTQSAKLGMNYIHITVEDHTRLASAHVLPDEKGPTCAAFLAKAAEFFASHRIRIHQVMTNNALNYPHSHDFQTMLAALQTTHILTRPHPPRQNSK